MTFNNGLPIKDKSEDKLNRTFYAEKLAEAILNDNNKKCLTIGLIGKWGSGKTSIINMARNNMQSEDLIILDFNPWYFSTLDNLYQQFFNLIIGAIETKEFGDKFWIQKKYSQLKTQLNQVSRLNKENKSKTQHAKEIILTLRELQHSDIINKYFAQVKSNSSINFNIPGVGYTYNFNDSTKEYNSISYLKSKCNEYFKCLGYKFLIIIDDLDRMTKTEIEQTLILVKSLADFDSFIYLLAFDDEIVSKSLTFIPKEFQKNYLEKIIQVYIAIPKISETHFNELISEKLEEFYKQYAPYDESNFDESIQREFLDVYSNLLSFLKTPRDLYRYINILNFNFTVFKDEVNRLDFMLILLIQLFEPKIYHEIKDNKDLFLVNSVNLNQKEENRIKIDRIIELQKNSSPVKIKKILFKLFPKLESYYNNIEYGSEWDRTWRYELRICVEAFFDKYFTLTLETNEISIVTINNLLNSTNSKEISNQILELNENNKTKYFLDIIINRMEDIPTRNACYFILSLIDIGDLLRIPYNMFFDKRIYLSRILNDLLIKFETQTERFKILKEAISNSKNSLYVAVDLLSDFDFKYNRFNYENDKQDPDILISEKQLEELEKIMIKKIKEADENGQLWENPNLKEILYNWKLWESESYVIKRVKEFTSNDENLLTFLKEFRKPVTTLHKNSPNEVNYDLDFESLQDYFDLEELNERLKNMENR